MDWQSAINAAENRLRAWAQQLVLNVVEYSPVTLTSSDGESDAVQGLPAEQGSQRDVRRVMRAGFRSRAVAQGAVLIKQGSRYFQVAEDDGANIAIEIGEAVAYSPGQPTARIFFDKDGNVTITTASGKPLKITAGAGADVVVNDGTEPVGRVGDAVQVTIPIGSFLTAATGGVLNAAPVIVTGTITAGAPHFKG